MRGKGTGDVLARGAVRAQYLTTETKVSDATWAAAFDDFDNEKFQKKERVKADGPKEKTRTGLR